jgi:hypothetical protein
LPEEWYSFQDFKGWRSYYYRITVLVLFFVDGLRFVTFNIYYFKLSISKYTLKKIAVIDAFPQLRYNLTVCR